MRYDRIRTSDEREMRRLVRRGALIMADYNWAGSGIPELERRGREWVLMVPTAGEMKKAA
jgi:hypothetical protein